MSKSLGNVVIPQEVTDKLGAEIVRLWVASTDYSGDLNIDDKILARVVDAYRRIRNTLRFLMANISDFDVQSERVDFQDLLEIDQYALQRLAQLQREITGNFDMSKGIFEGGLFGQYEFHPVVSKLQVYCSEDLGAFYLDILKDRLYTTAQKSHARLSAQTTLWHITQSLLRLMSPFLSFTAEEAWAVLGHTESIFTEKFQPMDSNESLINKWNRIRDIRDSVNKEIETLRAKGEVGASLQAEVDLTLNAEDHTLLSSLKEDLKFVMITSSIQLHLGSALKVSPKTSSHLKCERCWHYQQDVGSHAEHPGLCARCFSNLFSSGETRQFA
jgi:isoleucyl-tRNA synthetase